MSAIKYIKAREILDSRGNPTVEVEMTLASGAIGRAAVPSGASTGAHEALELRDGQRSRYLGKGVMKAVSHVDEIIGPAIKGKDWASQEEFDKFLLGLDGTPNKAKLGANALLGVSMAFLQARAREHDKWVFEEIGGPESVRLPVPLMNVLNGGAHADNGLDVQEFMIVPRAFPSFRECLRAGAEVFHTLKGILRDRQLVTAVGDEGGFAPALKSNQAALDLLVQAIDKAGYRPGEQIGLALDVAATELFVDGQYTWQGERLTAQQLGDVYASWIQKYPLLSIEDGFAEDDWAAWSDFHKKWGSKVQIVGDDLFVTNPTRIKKGVELSAANALLVKVNQIGTITETQMAIRVAREARYRTVMSHRSGETEDVMIADLAVGLRCEQIKTGSLCRTDRVAKYNQLLRIEECLGGRAIFGPGIG